MSPVYRWRLTDSGKRLWRLRTAFTLDELNESEFIDMLAAEPLPVADGTVCLSCGEVVSFMLAGFYCQRCCRMSFHKST